MSRALLHTCFTCSTAIAATHHNRGEVELTRARTRISSCGKSQKPLHGKLYFSLVSTEKYSSVSLRHGRRLFRILRFDINAVLGKNFGRRKVKTRHHVGFPCLRLTIKQQRIVTMLVAHCLLNKARKRHSVLTRSYMWV